MGQRSSWPASPGWWHRSERDTCCLWSCEKRDTSWRLSVCFYEDTICGLEKRGKEGGIGLNNAPPVVREGREEEDMMQRKWERKDVGQNMRSCSLILC